jgi:hypothetical protein
MHFAERIATKLARFGEEFTLGSATYRGIFKALDSGTMRTYLDDVEMMGVVHPALLLVTGPDVEISIDDTITRDGRVYYVLKTALQRIGDTPVAQIAILS